MTAPNDHAEVDPNKRLVMLQIPVPFDEGDLEERPFEFVQGLLTLFNREGRRIQMFGVNSPVSFRIFHCPHEGHVEVWPAGTVKVPMRDEVTDDNT